MTGFAKFTSMWSTDWYSIPNHPLISLGEKRVYLEVGPWIYHHFCDEQHFATELLEDIIINFFHVQTLSMP